MNKGRQYCITLFICVFSGYQGIKFNGWFLFWYAPEFVFGSCDVCRTLSREEIKYFSLYFSLWIWRKTYIFVSSAHPIQSILISWNNFVNFSFLLVYSKSIRFFIVESHSYILIINSRQFWKEYKYAEQYLTNRTAIISFLKYICTCLFHFLSSVFKSV